MVNRKKILFFGLGSIGLRHARLMQKLFNHDLHAFRTSDTASLPGIKNYRDINAALNLGADIAFITNPTNLHVSTALKCLDAGIQYIFIEKPLSNSLKDLDLLINKSEKLNAIIYIAYFMRHNPILKRLKTIIESKKDKIFYSETKCKSYLPNWRPGRDYRKVYSASKEMGGGVILDLSHEFDYNEMLFGKIKNLDGIYGKISNLELNSEDFCNVNVKFENNLIGTIYLDYYSFLTERFVRILADDEEIIADLIRQKITRVNKNSEITNEKFNFQLNDVYETQLKYFFENIEMNNKQINNLVEVSELIKKLINFKENHEMIHH
ncbi:MAG: Gfo/Idh/MocA family protein [Promethearchaeota archaeon]